MRKIKKYLCLILIVLLLLSGCNSVSTEELESTTYPEVDYDLYKSAEIMPDSFSNADAYNGVINGNPCFSISENGKDWTFYEYNYANESVRKSAVIEDFKMNMRYAVVDGDYWYSFVVLGDEPEPQLCRVNTETSEVSVIKRTLDTQSEFTLCKCNGKFVTLSKKSEAGVLYEYIETYDPESNNWNQIKEFSYSEESHEGDNPFGICSNGKNIYVLLEKDAPNGGKIAEILVLNDIGEAIESVAVSDDIYRYISQSFVFDMQMFGNYIYILSSNHCFVGIIEDGILKEIIKEDNLEVAFGYSGDSPIFFKRESRNLYELDTDSRVVEYYIPIEDDRSTILCSMADEEKCFVICIDYETGIRKGYMFDRKDLGNIYLPTN